jgi:uncharacterized cupredoxin-like copper-binding protein
MSLSGRSLIVVPAVVIAAALAGCGDSEDPATPAGASTNTAPAATQTTAAEPGPAVTVRMSEFAFDPQDAVAKAGKVKITAPNDGKSTHELVVLRTNADPAKLPMKGGEVDESTSVGEIADVEAGKTKSTTLDLAAGRYVMVCALPGHYQSGMYGTLTVK